MTSGNIQERIKELRNDNISGASEFIDKALEIIKYQLTLIKDSKEDIKNVIIDLSREIINSRPSMAPLINIIGYLISDLDVINKHNISYRIEQFSYHKLMREQTLVNIFKQFLSENYKVPIKIMLISYSSTIIKCLKDYNDSKLELYILESRPLYEGYRTAEILSEYFHTHLLIDAAMGRYIDEVDLVLIGIDSILKDGAIINKIGTFPLSVLAYNTKKDVIAVGDSYKYNIRSHLGQDIKIEEKPIEEIYKKAIQNNRIKVHNYYFDVTPPKYITGIISELGVLNPREFILKIAELLPVNWCKNLI